VSRRNVVAIPSSRATDNPSTMERGLLPWEDSGAFRHLRQSFTREHVPIGATEAALVDQLAWLEWRRRRLLVGERAAAMASLQDRLSADHKTTETIRRALIDTGDRGKEDELREFISTSISTDAAAQADADDDEARPRRAIAILESGDPNGYLEAVAAVREDTANWWEDFVGDDEQTHPNGMQKEGEDYLPFNRTGDSLLRFLAYEVLPIFAKTRGEIARRPAIRLQAEGESMDPFRMDRILAIDERLTRQFEKTLSMLIRLQEMRANQSHHD
jgi:hypothetical protein